MVISEVKGFFKIERIIADKFTCAEDFSEALEASATIPILTRLGLVSSYRGKRTIDGGLSGSIPNKYVNSKKIFINVLPKFTLKWPFVR